MPYFNPVALPGPWSGGGAPVSERDSNPGTPTRPKAIPPKSGGDFHMLDRLMFGMKETQQANLPGNHFRNLRHRMNRIKKK